MTPAQRPRQRPYSIERDVLEREVVIEAVVQVVNIEM